MINSTELRHYTPLPEKKYKSVWEQYSDMIWM